MAFNALALLVWLFLPAGLQALDVATGSAEIRDILSDVSCITLKDDAALSLALEQDHAVSRVVDSQGRSYSAVEVSDAVDGYLRGADICVIRDVKVSGTRRISEEAIRFRIKTAKGDILHRQTVKADIENVYSMGYFESCTADWADGVLTFKVEEYPVIVAIEVEGNDKIKDDKIIDAVGLRKFEILNTKTLKTGVDRIKALYREKGYYDVAISSTREDTEGGIILRFSIDERKRLFVRQVSFDGNHNIKSRKLRKIMETKNRWVWGLFNHKGAYMDPSIDTDLLRVEQYYADQGYLNVKVGRPQVEIRPDDGIYVTIPIQEGDVYHIGSIAFAGELIETEEELRKKMDLKEGEVMSRTKVHKGIEAIRDTYMDQGYAYAQIDTQTAFEALTVNLTVEAKKNDPVHIDRIIIRGNQKTRDKVVRREIQLNEGDLFSSSAIKDSKNRLMRLGYFTTAEIETVPGGKDDISLLVDLEETTTGAFSFGISYSSTDKMLGTVELSENNFMGYGLKTKLGLEYGKKKKNYSVDIEQPWLFDYNLAVGVNLYSKEEEETYYTQKSRGGNLRMGFPLFERVRQYVTYGYEDVLGLDDIDPTYQYLLSYDDINGGVTSSIATTIYRDTTNDYYRPTGGSELSFTVQYAGLGGDYHYTRTTAKAAVFFPLYKDDVALMLKARWGTINGGNGEDVPTGELFTLGGLNTVRGFEYGEIGPRDYLGNVVGGRKMCIFNAEITCPVPGVPGLSGVLFYDAGNAYSNRIDLTNIKQSYGVGFRWVTPMGPLRLEYGRVIDPESWESSGRWDFTIGTFF